MTIPTHPASLPEALPHGVPRPGEVLAGKYRLERVLGVGGMGVVLAATHLELEEKVAIKFLLPSAVPSPDAVSRFLREARAAIKIKSEGVVRVLDVARLESGTPYIVMEYLHGHDLAQLVEIEGPMPVADAVSYVIQACEALAAAHALGIVHRDLKPANLFVVRGADGMPKVKVLDFGISKIQDDGRNDVTTTATIMGTPCYMSPEQLRSTKDVDGRADIWALGTILYALLTGAPPYYAETTADVAAKIIRDAPPTLRSARADAPEALEAVISRCLAKAREDRYPDVAALAEALAPFASGDAQLAATRVRRVMVSPSTYAVATAPTLRSDPPRHRALSPSSSGPTRTASAWVDTKPDAPKPRNWRLIGGGVVVASALLAAALGVGLARPHVKQGTIQPAAPLPETTIATTTTTATATATTTTTATATANSTAIAGAAATPTPATKSASSAKPPAAKPSPGKPPVSPSSTVTPPTKPQGLFDDRE